ncbi:uncharacterized protein A1O9_12818 [Exophiala aquamarina CBS 119918]|uniref:Uncharacterized protein n=1 Tax=Exophiala aquamarina CBS 119918 TaxID=1182545 RepID=A0A072P641_9EURO|nr:uncharacterized protein A1O9_12818 [Exophiala aquamarina CBS 119918]KEF51095.1 hypothetical protein A1O9_12818 [Exophiala aquamarina CBS 119918]
MEPVLNALHTELIPVSHESPKEGDDHLIKPSSTTAIETTEMELSSSTSSGRETSRDPPVVESATSDTSLKILEVIFDYALNKFSDSRQRLEAGRPRFLSVIEKFISVGAPVETCLPAFPFKCVILTICSVETVVISPRLLRRTLSHLKTRLITVFKAWKWRLMLQVSRSANKVYKVLGILPDKAEEIALKRLNDMCLRIGTVHAPGARCTIISDGLVYNGLLYIPWIAWEQLNSRLIRSTDLLSISDRDTWAYGQALRAMALEKGFDRIRFSRLRDFVDFPLPDKLEEITYVANATNFRRFIFNKFGKDDIDIDYEIATNPDTKMTYLGYRRFLESDLKYIFPLGDGRSNHSYKKAVGYVAKQMLIRGYAFASVVKHAFGDHLRLSIHQSTGEHKISMSLLNTKTGFTTPWHCSVALMADGDWVSAPMGEFKNDPRMKLVYENDRPSYFEEVTVDEGGHECCSGLAVEVSKDSNQVLTLE